MAIGFDVVVSGFEGFGIELAGSILSLTGTFYQASVFEDFEVLGDGGEGDIEGFGELVNGAFAGGESGEDSSPSGIGKGGES